MPDWRRAIRELVAAAALPPTAELDVIEELAQHVEDRYMALSAQGVAESDALAQSLRELQGQSFLADLRASLPRT